MPNGTLSADAQAMPIDRRAALGAIAAAGAMLGAPCIAKGADLDADLFALAPAIEAVDREIDDVIDALRIAEDRARRSVPEKPAAPEIDRESREAIEALGRTLTAIRAGGPSAEQVAHDEAMRQWEAEAARARAESGLDAAHEAEAKALDAAGKIQARVAETPARTLAGLIFKARYAAKRDHDPIVMASIVDDLIRMAGEA
jgi:hypothetical protein